MKKLIFPLTCALIILLASACSNGENKKKDDKDSSSDTTDQIVEDVSVESGKLNPFEINADEAILIDELNEVVFAWNNQTVVTITGYCDFFFDEGSIGDGVELMASPDDGEILVECEMKEDYDEEFSKTIPVTIKGTLVEDFWGLIQLVDCELITTGEALEATTEYIDPYIYNGENIAIQDFYNSYYGWMDKEVSVIGYYKSTTTSTTDYGKTIRLDIAGDSTKAGCRLADDAINPEITERNDVIVKGIIKGDFFGDVLLEECEVINR